MSKLNKWTLRLVAFLSITFLLMLSGIFDPLSESLKYTITNIMNFIPTEKIDPYPDRVEYNYFSMYITFNAFSSAVLVFIFEKIIWLVRNY